MKKGAPLFWLLIAGLGIYLLVSGRYHAIWGVLSGHPAAQGSTSKPSGGGTHVPPPQHTTPH